MFLGLDPELIKRDFEERLRQAEQARTARLVKAGSTSRIRWLSKRVHFNRFGGRNQLNGID